MKSLFTSVLSLSLLIGTQAFAATTVDITGDKSGVMTKAWPLSLDNEETLEFGMKIVSPRDPQTGQASGKRMHKPVRFYMVYDAPTSQKLQAAMATGEHMRVAVVSTDSSGAVYSAMRMEDCTIFSLGAVSRASTGRGQIQEVSFTFQKIEMMASKTMGVDDWQR